MPKKDLKIGDLIFVRKYVDEKRVYLGISEGEPGIILDIRPSKYSYHGRYVIITLYWKQVLGYNRNEIMKLNKNKEDKFWLYKFKDCKNNEGILYDEDEDNFTVGKVEYRDSIRGTKKEIIQYNKIIKNIKRRF